MNGVARQRGGDCCHVKAIGFEAAGCRPMRISMNLVNAQATAVRRGERGASALSRERS